ncbi:hypothetical protein ACSLVN_27755, partial [Klebsiella pneumoniae]|uniref:hypothetical protein n=1 Tax=Klebsiella pneumoniae TaxID=573 RepID=UPI003EDE89DF
ISRDGAKRVDYAARLMRSHAPLGRHVSYLSVLTLCASLTTGCGGGAGREPAKSPVDVPVTVAPAAPPERPLPNPAADLTPVDAP